MTWWAWLSWGVVLLLACLLVAAGIILWLWHRHHGPTTLTLPGAHFLPSDRGKDIYLGDTDGPATFHIVNVDSATQVTVRKR